MHLRTLPLPAAVSARLLVVPLVALAACGREEPARRPDSVVAVVPVVRTDSVVPTPPPNRPTWDEATAGPALFVASDSAHPTAAEAVLPEAEADATDSALVSGASRLSGLTLDLFSPAGKVGTAGVGGASEGATPGDEECAPWPPVRLTTVPPRSWTVAFTSGRAAPLPADSLEGLPAADSARRAAEVARLASLAPGTNTREFAGLPFAVRQARRFTQPGGVDVLVAEAVRRIGQEANPREQHVLVVAERAGGTTGKYDLAYHETSAGGETSVETRDVLAAVALGADRRPTLVLNRAYEDALAYSLLERVGPKQWRVRWTSAKLACDVGA